MANDVTPIKVGCTINWAFLKHANPNEDEKFDDEGKLIPYYTVDLCNLSKGAVAALEAMDIEVKFDEKYPEKGHHIKCRSKKPYRVVYDGTELSTDIRVGNGSKGIALVGTYEWTFKKKKGVSPGLKALTVTELIEYSGGGEAPSPDDEDVL